MKKIICLLFALAILIYGLQLWIFHDPTNTGFYILQDFAFLPISIAVATIVVGEYLSQKEKRERLQKIQMLTSGFFTDMGMELLFALVPLAQEQEGIRCVFRDTEIQDQKSMKAVQDCLRGRQMHVKINKEMYEKLTALIDSRHSTLLVISSNPLLLEHDDFIKLIWALFHLIDEIRLRGDYDSMSVEDQRHIDADFSELLKLLLLNWAENVLFVKKKYPNYYNAALAKLTARNAE